MAAPLKAARSLAAGLTLRTALTFTALLFNAALVSAQSVVIESTEPVEDAVDVPLETVVTFNLNKPTPAMGSEFVSKFRWGPVSDMTLTVFGHDFDDQNELTIIFFTMDHEPQTDFAFWAFGVRAEDNSRMAAPFTLNYTTAATTGSHDVSGALQFGDRSVGGASKAGPAITRSADATADAPARLGDHIGYFRRSLAASGLKTGGQAEEDAGGAGARILNTDGGAAQAFVDASRDARTAPAKGADAQPTIGYSVALLLNSYSLNENVWRVRKAAAADASGQFSFDHVRDGTYYPVAFNWTDITGSTIGSYGFYDADGDLQPDPITVSGGSVTGIDFDLYEAGPFVADANLDLAYDLALREADDARLVRVRSLDGPVFQSVYDDATADLWGYTFHSASLESLIYIAIDPINVFIDVDGDFGFDRGEIADLAIGSEQALAIADAAGGDEFRAQYSGQTVPVYMDAGDLDLQVRPAAGEIFWQVRYRSPAGVPVDDELNVFVDVQTGDVLSAMDVAADRHPDVPSLARLMPVYPNPVVTETTLSFELDRPADVRLRVYDVLGREVETPVEASFPAGIYRKTWRPDGLPAGMYVIRLEADGAVHTTSVLLAR